ncbi:MAG: hypothetical protein HYV09_08385 [Deltaproteobacteria bacterium]|nr:hypothetical protein [Deltaproteobacteria bacterium]
MAAKKSKLTPALAKRASALAEAARLRLLKQAREDVSLIKRRKSEIAEAFYDIGEALLRLRKEPIPKLLGFKGFNELCRQGLDLSPSSAGKLIEIVERLPRRDALKWGKEKAHALIELADATPATDSPQKIDPKALGATDPKRATVRELQALAQRARGQKKTPSPRGRTTTAEERALAAKLQATLRKAGAKEATVAALATKPGAPAKLRLELPIDRLAELREAIGSVHRRR